MTQTISFEGLPEKPTQTDASRGSSEESLEQKNACEVQQARLSWQTRTGNSLALTVRWRRFYQTHKHPQASLKRIERELQARINVLAMQTQKPDRFMSGPTWTRAMERLEDVEAELSVVRRCLKDGGQ